MARFPLLTVLLLPAVALAGFNASSYKKESRTSTASPYDAAAALDGNPATAWLVDPEQSNKGSWIELDVPKGKVDKISLIVGWDQSEEVWNDHARLKAARVEVISMANGVQKVVHESEFTFEDKREFQTFELPDVQVGDELDGGKVRLTVTDVYPGKDYAHLALGELLVHMIEFDATIRNAESTSSAQEGHDKDMLVDDSTKTYWLSAVDDETPTFEADAGRFSVSSIGITPGPSSYGRPKTIEIVQGSGTKTYTVQNNAKLQYFALPPLFGYTGSNFGGVTVKVTEVYEGSNKGVAIADVRFKATALEAF